MKYIYPQAKISDKELLEIFPEAREIIPLKIREYKSAIRKKENEIQSQLSKLYSLKTDSFSEWFGEEVIKLFLMPDLSILEKRLFRLKRFQYLLHPTRKTNERFEFEEKIRIAREYPIAELARNKLELRQAGSNFISLCPFHSEKHASFYIYPATNSYHCYGCGAHGDQLNFLMALEEVPFVDAVNMLQN